MLQINIENMNGLNAILCYVSVSKEIKKRNYLVYTNVIIM